MLDNLATLAKWNLKVQFTQGKDLKNVWGKNNNYYYYLKIYFTITLYILIDTHCYVLLGARQNKPIMLNLDDAPLSDAKTRIGSHYNMYSIEVLGYRKTVYSLNIWIHFPHNYL